jgi:hypothetical protein
MQNLAVRSLVWLNARTGHGDFRSFHGLVHQRTTALPSDREGELSMKSLLLIVTVVALSFGFGACANNGTSTTSNPNKPVPPGSGGRGDTPGQHAESQNPR